MFSAMNLRIKSISFQFYIAALLLCTVVLLSCERETIDTESTSSIKILNTISEPMQVKVVTNSYGSILSFVTSGDVHSPLERQELFLMNRSGNGLQIVFLSDTLFQYMNAVPGLNGGFMVCASSNGYPYISLFQVDDNGMVSWSKNIPAIGGVNRNEPAIITYDNNYLVMYQSYGSGFFIWKGDANGNDIFNKKIPIPNAIHYGTGFNFGEKYVQLLQVNDTIIVIQGITYDQYSSQMIENCFLRSVNENIAKKWYSDNYDSTSIESSSGLFHSANDKIVLFGTKSTKTINEGFGDVFSRTYSLSGVFEDEIIYPRTESTPNKIMHTIHSPDGGYLMIGSNNQFFANDIVSPNRMILMKLNADLSLNWTKSIPTSFPAKGFDAVYLKDGSIGLMGLLKDNYSTNKLLYIHLDAFGNIINE